MPGNFPAVPWEARDDGFVGTDVASRKLDHGVVELQADLGGDGHGSSFLPPACQTTIA